MSEKTWKRNTTAIMAHATRRREQKRKGVEDAITALLREQKPINFNTVAKAAMVSKAYLYSQPDLRERIEALRQQGVEQMVRERVTRSLGKTDASRDLVILAGEHDLLVKALGPEKDRRPEESQSNPRPIRAAATHCGLPVCWINQPAKNPRQRHLSGLGANAHGRQQCPA